MVLKTSIAVIENSKDREKRVQRLLDLIFGKEGVKSISLSGIDSTRELTRNEVETMLCKC